MSRMIRGAVWILFLAAPTPGQEPPEPEAPAAAGSAVSTPHALFTEANQLFERARSEEDLRRAAAAYGQLIDSGTRNGHLYYNLGNTYLRLGDPGLAILNYRRALLYIPDNPYATAMLEEARSQTLDRFEGSGGNPVLKTLFFWHFRYSPHARLWAFLLACLVFWSLLALRLFRPSLAGRWLLPAFLAIALCLGISVAVDLLEDRGMDAVVVAKETQVRSGNGTNYDVVFERPVHSGVEVRILETRRHWRQVEFPGGTVGWLPAGAVEPVEP